MNVNTKKIYVKAKYIDEEVTLYRRTYQDGGRVRISAVDRDGIPCFVATVNLPEVPIESDETILKGWGENEGLPEVLERYGIVGPVLRTVKSGFVEAEVRKLLWTP